MNEELIEIDGSQGEGGGQMVRSSLTLALVTCRAFTIRRIRANRDKPGLKRQHLTACKAAAQIGCAKVEGDELGSRELSFRPSILSPGEYQFDVGSAGGTMLVAQTLIPALIIAGASSQITIDGGTHNEWAPPFEFVERVYLPLINRLGPKVSIRLERHGFYPAGQGRIVVQIEPQPLRGFDLMERGEFRSRQVRALVANIHGKVAEREVDTAIRSLSWSDGEGHAIQVKSAGPGNVVMVEQSFENVSEMTSAFGRIGLPAEKVAANSVREMRNYLKRDAPVGEHLADQWMLPLAIAVARTGCAHSFHTTTLSQHSVTHLQIIKRFLPVTPTAEQHDDSTYIVTIMWQPGKLPVGQGFSLAER
jgi:RNA 3'-terminal phosphate cyclase (ATP)